MTSGGPARATEILVYEVFQGRRRRARPRRVLSRARYPTPRRQIEARLPLGLRRIVARGGVVRTATETASAGIVVDVR